MKEVWTTNDDGTSEKPKDNLAEKPEKPEMTEVDLAKLTAEMATIDAENVKFQAALAEDKLDSGQEYDKIKQAIDQEANSHENLKNPESIKTPDKLVSGFYDKERKFVAEFHAKRKAELSKMSFFQKIVKNLTSYDGATTDAEVSAVKDVRIK